MIEILARTRLPIAPVLPDELARKMDLFSGAVPNYSLEPVELGYRWIDGQPVWRRVFILVSGTALNADNMILHIAAGWGFSGLVAMSGYLTTTTDHRIPLNYYGSATSFIGVRITASGDIIERHGAADMSSRTMILVIDYLSVPTGSSAWDGSATFWDADLGGSSWDAFSRTAQPYWDAAEGGAEWDVKS